MSVNRYSGKVLWSKRLEGLVGFSSCGRRYSHNRGLRGHLRAYGVQQPDVEPIEIWRVEIGGCLEATPTVWEGRIYIGSREGGCLRWASDRCCALGSRHGYRRLRCFMSEISIMSFGPKSSIFTRWPADSQMLWSDCYASLALVADRTSKINIGTGVSVW